MCWCYYTAVLLFQHLQRNNALRRTACAGEMVTCLLQPLRTCRPTCHARITDNDISKDPKNKTLQQLR
jgi:hypothetical protein